ncbi:sensor histidine kinase [Rhodococcus sp. 077-4]|uniref:sensor histidine kinase n=1 Tax=Rhodococcus sp. 077-4 TaxID=2789271 RepID=UPI0039F4BB1B
MAVVVLRVGRRPSSIVAHSAEAIAAGSLTNRLPTRGDRSETDQLAHAVNRAFDGQARAENTVRSFVADASHELRTPLSTISGWLDLRGQGGMTAVELENAVSHIDNEVGRMRLVVEELGLLARLDERRPLEHEPVELEKLAESVVEDALVVSSDRDITLESDGPGRVVGDEARLQQVLRNLVGNAVLHTPQGTAVVVRIESSSSGVTVKVIDDGPGIGPDDLPRVFERFWRAEASRSRATGGSGLGLAIVQAIIRAHGAKIEVQSRLGSGSTFTVTFETAERRR